MVTVDNLNRKAFHELMLYYLRERITEKNLEVRHLIITNIHEWFIFDAQVFEKLFAQNKAFVRRFEQFESKQLSASNTSVFYNEIAKPFLDKLESEIAFTHINLKDYDSVLKKGSSETSKKLIALYKIFSPEHLLKLSFANDSNSLNRDFYKELLHIIGLEDKKDKGKHIIQRKPKDQRDPASLLENTIKQLDKRDLIYQVENPTQYGASKEDQLFGVGLELVITWINRVLFLKLLEAQLISYNKDKAFAFLNSSLIHDYDDLDDLFFGVLAKRTADRDSENQEKFGHVPYLNSSLFEATSLESKALFVSTLRDERQLPIASGTVLKDENGKKRKGELSTLDYLFSFLDAYDFSSENGEEIQEEKKTLINASVLGLIFEKINGYKDGSFFTPGFITMYMCRETIRRAVLQKFNESLIEEGDQRSGGVESYQSIDELYSDIGRGRLFSFERANAIINSLKICDPAVGSGHFLVSALNELIAIKSELEILIDKDGKPLRDCTFEVINDELIVKLDDELFQYNPKNPTSQRIQETIFHEKQTIIENCLFGVDINPNSVKICRLRLWIELLKHAYYLSPAGGGGEAGGGQLETLPNIDINIKCGNSLISRFGLDEDLSGILKSVKWDIEAYRGFVRDYKHASNKEEKKGLEKLIEQIKGDFKTEIDKKDKRIIRKNRLEGELFNLTQANLFEETQAQKKKRLAQIAKKEKEFNKLATEIEEIKSSKIFENAFEWRFAFPEVLDDNGDFLGFDVVIGNPPYIRIQDLNSLDGVVEYYKTSYVSGRKGNYDIYVLFIELGIQLAKNETGQQTWILPHKFINSSYGEGIRKLISQEEKLVSLVHFGAEQVFEDATTYTCLLSLSNCRNGLFELNLVHDLNFWKSPEGKVLESVPSEAVSSDEWHLMPENELSLLEKLRDDSKILSELTERIYQGLKTSADPIFIVKLVKKLENGNLIIHCPQNSKEYEVEPGLFHELIKGGDGKRYFFKNTGLKILFPYENGKILKNEAIESQSPLTWSYLLEHKDYLENRERGRFKGDFWFQFGRNQAVEIIYSPKIFTPDISPAPSFAFDNLGNKFFTGGVSGGYGIVPIELKDNHYLLAILNSKVTNWYITKTSTQMRGGWYSFESRFIKSIPIKSASDNRKKKIESKVDQILSLKKENPQADTSALEAEIDQMVYELYGLSEEEIKIVEGEN